MIELTASAQNVDEVVRHVTSGETELCAVLLTSQYVRRDGLKRLLVRDILFPDASDYSRVGKLEAELKPDYVARVSKRARHAGMGIVFVHSHPGTHSPKFSDVDDEGEQLLSAFTSHRNADQTHLALVVSRGGMACRVLGSQDLVQVITLGNERETLTNLGPLIALDSRYDRQVRAFGPEGQRAIQNLRVAIVGLGGTGSIVAQELVHLGVSDFILIDPDSIDETNLNRVANTGKIDIGKPKVEVAGRYLSAVNASVNMELVKGDIVRTKYARLLTDSDFIFGCTDSHGSRAVLQLVSYQYLIPCIDIGLSILVQNGSIFHIIGRVQTLSPGLGCFTCANLLDSNEVRRDMMSDAERQQDPYLQGVHEPAPAVMSFNGTISSMAVTMFMSYVAHIRAPARHLIYDAVASRLRSVRVEPQPDCYVCSKSGAYARADSQPLTTRPD